MAQAITILEGSIWSVISNVEQLHSSSQKFLDYVEPSLLKGEQSINDLLMNIGNKPLHLSSQFDSPTLWSSLWLMSSELQNVANQVNFNWNKINTNMKNVASKTVSETLIPEQKEVHDRINLINESLITLSTKLQDLMEAHLDSSLEDEHSQSLSRKKQNHF